MAEQQIAVSPETAEIHACLAFLHGFFPELPLPRDVSEQILKIRDATMREMINLAGAQGVEYESNLSAVIPDEDGGVHTVQVDEAHMTIQMIYLHLSAISSMCAVSDNLTRGENESELKLAAAGGYREIAELMESHVDELLEIASEMDAEEAKTILLGECEKARVVVSSLAFCILGMPGPSKGYKNSLGFLFKPTPQEETIEIAKIIDMIEPGASGKLTADAVKLHNSRVRISRLIGMAMILVSFTPTVVLAKPLIDMLADELQTWARVMFGVLHSTIILGCLAALNMVFGGILGKLKIKDTLDPEVIILRFRGLIRKYKLLFDGDKRLHAEFTKEFGVDFHKQAGDIAELEDMIREMGFSRGEVAKLMFFFREVMDVKESMRNVAAGKSLKTQASETAEDVDSDEITSAAPRVLS